MSIHIAHPGGDAHELELGSALPDALPVLPLKDSVPFPDTLTPLAVGQERSVRLVNEVLGGDRMLVMVASKNPELDTPGPDDLYRVGVAGVDPSRVALEIRGRRLIIAGERRGQDATGCFYQQVEIEHGPFRREIELGTDVDADRARATYDNGILRVEVPVVLPEEQVRSIPVRKAVGPRTGDES